MSKSFTRNIAPFVHRELEQAFEARKAGDTTAEFHHLENAHVIGQESTYWHVKVHVMMFLWSLRNADPREFVGQLLRIVGAATKTAVGLIPQGNTGGANISPFRPLPLKPEHRRIIEQAKSNA